METCSLCSVPLEGDLCSVPTYLGRVISNEFPDDLWSTAGGSKPVCQSCYHDHADGLVPTFDHLFLTPGLIGGEGI